MSLSMFSSHIGSTKRPFFFFFFIVLLKFSLEKNVEMISQLFFCFTSIPVLSQLLSCVLCTFSSLSFLSSRSKSPTLPPNELHLGLGLEERGVSVSLTSAIRENENDKFRLTRALKGVWTAVLVARGVSIQLLEIAKISFFGGVSISK